MKKTKKANNNPKTIDGFTVFECESSLSLDELAIPINDKEEK